MDSVLKDRLEQKFDIITTVADYTLLLQELSDKTGTPVDELRKERSRWTYKQWNKEFKNLQV